MTRRHRRRVIRWAVDASVTALIFAGAVWLAMLVLEVTAERIETFSSFEFKPVVDGHTLADEYSRTDFYQPEEQ